MYQKICSSAVVSFLLLCTIAAQEGQGEPPPWVDTSENVPSDAVVIFDGTNTDLLAGPNGGPCSWPVEDGILICKPGGEQRQHGLWTRLHFRDAQIHAEFLVPNEGAGNSGLYFHGLFEQQIINSFETPRGSNSMIGAIYGISPPLVNAARPPEQWQVYDVIFKAPRRDEQGEPIEPGSFTSLLNGVLVQHETEIVERVSTYAPLYYRTTPYSDKILECLLASSCGPMQLQNHGNPVQYKNIWIRPLDDKAFMFTAEGEQVPLVQEAEEESTSE